MTLDFESVYKLYPLKRGKRRGIQRCKQQIKTPERLEELRQAILNYRQDCEKEKREPRFIKHFATFMLDWEDWLDDDVGTCNIKTPQQIEQDAMQREWNRAKEKREEARAAQDFWHNSSSDDVRKGMDMVRQAMAGKGLPVPS